MIAVDDKRLNDAVEVLGPRSIEKALKARRAMRLRDRMLAAAALPAGETAPWFVVTTGNRAEISVDNDLDRKGVERWLPMKKGDETRRGCRPVATRLAKLVPAFPGYLFVRIVPSSDAWQGLLSLDGVAAIIGSSDGRPFPVCCKIVNKLKMMIEDGELDRTVEAKRLKVGDRVAVKDGPFGWEEGELDWIEEAREGYVGTLHVRVLMSIFGRMVPVSLTLDQIAKSD